MPRPIWKGHISFGLVSIPVVLMNAISPRRELHFTMLDKRDHSRIKYQRVNATTGKDVPWPEIVKGYNTGDNFVLVTDKDFKNAAVEATQTVDILDFVQQDEIDRMYYDKPFHIVPGKKGEKGYSLLREVLERTGKVAIGKVVIRTREHLAAVFPHNGALVLNLLRFDHELVKLKELHLPAQTLKPIKVSPKELDVANQLVEAMTSKWKPEKYRDEYYDKMMKYIERKAKAGGVEVPPEEKPQREAKVYDMLDLLKKSVGDKHARPKIAKAAQRKRAPARKGKLLRMHAA
ncbi:MAG: Ku protein [Planctomycetes bacterium]|nr:Ku protein [Planctomycetota bacterium]